MQARHVHATIVLFGGTRIVEPHLAQQQVAAIEAELETAPSDPHRNRQLTVARRVLHNSRYYTVAREFARRVGEAHREADEALRFFIMTGGGPGIMEAGNRGAFEAGCESLGLNITVPAEQFPNPYVTPELCFQFRYFALRKMHFLKRAKALVAFPGGYGTFDELFDALCLVQTGKIDRMPIILVGHSFWSKAFNASFLVDEGVISPEDAKLFCFAETADEIWEIIRKRYAPT